MITFYVYGQDIGVICILWAAWAVWCLDDPEQAEKMSQAGLSMAHEFGHVFAAYNSTEMDTLPENGGIKPGIARACLAVASLEPWIKLLAPFHLAYGGVADGRAGRLKEGLEAVDEGMFFPNEVVCIRWRLSRIASVANF